MYEDSPMTWQDFYHAQDHLEGLIEDLYETGAIDNLEFHLEEVLRIFKLSIPKKDPVISKTKPAAVEALDSWIQLTKDYAKAVSQ